jgi:hypothetical protein
MVLRVCCRNFYTRSPKNIKPQIKNPPPLNPSKAVYLDDGTKFVELKGGPKPTVSKETLPPLSRKKIMHRGEQHVKLDDLIQKYSVLGLASKFKCSPLLISMYAPLRGTESKMTNEEFKAWAEKKLLKRQAKLNEMQQ